MQGGSVFPSIIRLISAGRLNPLPMVTQKVSLAQIIEAMASALKITEGKIIVTMEQT